MLAQTPTGALLDNLRQQCTRLIPGIAFFTTRPVVMGVAGAIFTPCLAAYQPPPRPGAWE